MSGRARESAASEAALRRLARVVAPGRDLVGSERDAVGRHALARAAEGDSPSQSGFVDRREARASRWHRLVDGLADHVPPTVRTGRWRLSGRATAGIVLALITAIVAAGLAAARNGPEMITAGIVATTPLPRSAPGSTDQHLPATTSGFVVVHVAGLVVAPGVFTLPVGSRVVDAVKAAGGAQPGVDTSGLNLARLLVDGEQIAVGVPAAPDADGVTGSASSAAGQPLDLNTATDAELDELPGVGPVLAGRIIAWREEHGRFTAVEELLEVSGIGAATFADLAGLVRV